ncbi:CatB-related O-acetyltransferase [Niveibacterium sp. SC-1]|uniref:CatB-related O-acetyltransferase n=1 Tax=Niveibacterium sp. SC-1 TaxID=3135646 RepID=UPI00311E42B8
MQDETNSPRRIGLIRDLTRSRYVVAGRCTYYSGEYHAQAFDECVRYLRDGPDADRLIFGSFCSVASGAVFVMGGNQGHRHDWLSTYPFFYAPREAGFADARDAYRKAGDTVIGSDVWIGTEALIMPGVKVGHGAVIASRAAVTRDVPPYAIVGGNPAQVIRSRFGEADVAQLLEIAWWDWPMAHIRAALPLLCDGGVAALHDYWLVHRPPASSDE